MNRGFLLVLIPAALVAVAHSGVRWGPQVAVPLGIVLAVLVAAVYLWMRRRQSAKDQS